MGFGARSAGTSPAQFALMTAITPIASRGTRTGTATKRTRACSCPLRLHQTRARRSAGRATEARRSPAPPRGPRIFSPLRHARGRVNATCMIHWFVGVLYDFVAAKQHELLLRAHSWDDASSQLEQFREQNDLKHVSARLYPVESDCTYWNGDRFEQMQRPTPPGSSDQPGPRAERIDDPLCAICRSPRTAAIHSGPMRGYYWHHEFARALPPSPLDDKYYTEGFGLPPGRREG
jgi:hypothetical protein